jgi:alkylation response protein AidB-like acyl-CoA dehydrogenase
LAKCAAASDANEPNLVGGEVQLIAPIKAALDAYREAGFFAAGVSVDDGGLGLSVTLQTALLALFSAANAPTTGYAVLTAAATHLLSLHGDQALKSRFLKPLQQGEFFATMCLSETQAGSSVGDLRTAATLTATGHYHLRGSKMWISGADHLLCQNIVHFVLARIDGSPAGSKGISLFAVPKFLDDGVRNGVQVVGLNHKLGYRGTVNGVLNFGEDTPCVAYLVGAAGGGMACMFSMMNQARLGVGTGAAAMGVAGTTAALTYARERRQGRAIHERDPGTPQIPIIEHSDVKRMLLRARSLSEGALSLCLYAASVADIARGDGAAATDANAILSLLTPIVKSWSSDYALIANDLAIQVHGGYGYTRDFAVERLWRDNRLNPIHEGTNGIQALDLLGRKILGDDGKALKLLGQKMQMDLLHVASDATFGKLAGSVLGLLSDLQRALGAMPARMMFGDSELVLAQAPLVMDILGTILVAWRHLLTARTANNLLLNSDGSNVELDNRHRGLIAVTQYFFRYELPRVRWQLERLENLDDLLIKTQAAWI